MTDQPESDIRTYTIHIDKKPFHDQPRYVKGAYLLGLVGLNDGKHSIAILRGGGEHDIPVGLEQTVDLSDEQNRRFKTYRDKSTEGASCR